MVAVAALILGLLTMTVQGAAAADEDPGSSPQNPIVVADPGEVPEGAVEDEVSTYETPAECDTTRSWVLPATDAQTHDEFSYSRVIPAVEEQSHLEWGVEERTRTMEEVPVYSTRWTINLVYAEGVYSDVWYSYNPAVDEDGDPTTGSITKEDGWQLNQGDHTGLYANPSFTVNQVWQSTGGQGAYWFVERTYQIDPGAVYAGPFEVVQDAAPTSYEGQTIGVPFELDGALMKYVLEGSDQVQTGTETVYGDWTAWEQTQSGLTVEPTPPVDTDTHEYQVTGPETVVDVEAQPERTEYYTGGEPSANEDDAVYVSFVPEGDPAWVQLDQRTVTDEDGTPAVYFAWSDGVECPDEPGEEPGDDSEDPVDVLPAEAPAGGQAPGQQAPVSTPPAGKAPSAVPTSIDAGL